MAKKTSNDAARQAALAATRGYTKQVKSPTGSKCFEVPSGIEFFNLKEEDVIRLNFLPYRITVDNHRLDIPKGGMYWTRTVLMHPRIGVNKESIVCPRTIEKPCPICEYSRDPNLDQDEAAQNRAKLRGLYNVAYESEPDTPMFWCISAYKFGTQLGSELEYASEDQLGFWLPDSGLCLKLRIRYETMGRNKFLTVERIDFEERSKDYDESIADRTVDLDNCLNVLDYKELYNKFYEIEAEDEAKDQHTAADASVEGPDKGGENEDEIPYEFNNESSSAESDEKDDAEKRKEERREQRRKRQEQEKSQKQEEQSEANENECPAGHRFGEDNDEYPEDCEECEKWEACADKYDELHP